MRWSLCYPVRPSRQPSGILVSFHIMMNTCPKRDDLNISDMWTCFIHFVKILHNFTKMAWLYYVLRQTKNLKQTKCTLKLISYFTFLIENFFSTFTELELSRTEGSYSWSVPYWNVPRSPSCSLGWYREFSYGTETTRRRHTHLWTHTQVWGIWAREQVLHQPRISYWSLQCFRQVRHLSKLKISSFPYHHLKLLHHLNLPIYFVFLFFYTETVNSIPQLSILQEVLYKKWVLWDLIKEFWSNVWVC